MSKGKRAKRRNVTSDGFAYLTTRKLISRAHAAGKIASQKAMENMGYVVTVQGGQIVKKWANGQVEVLQPVAG